MSSEAESGTVVRLALLHEEIFSSQFLNCRIILFYPQSWATKLSFSPTTMTVLSNSFYFCSPSCYVLHGENTLNLLQKIWISYDYTIQSLNFLSAAHIPRSHFIYSAFYLDSPFIYRNAKMKPTRICMSVRNENDEKINTKNLFLAEKLHI